nr:uncharacterized protein LOC106679456 [Halyomorpha halys]
MSWSLLWFIIMSKCVYCGDTAQSKNFRYQTNEPSRSSFLGPSIDETVIYLICAISSTLGQKLNLLHKDSEQNHRTNGHRRSSTSGAERKHYKRRESTMSFNNPSLNRPSETRCHSPKEKEHRRRSSLNGDNILYRVCEQFPSGIEKTYFKDKSAKSSYSRNLYQ